MSLERCPGETTTDCGTSNPLPDPPIPPSLTPEKCTHKSEFNSNKAITMSCVSKTTQDACEDTSECTWNPVCGDTGASLLSRVQVVRGSKEQDWYSQCFETLEIGKNLLSDD